MPFDACLSRLAKQITDFGADVEDEEQAAAKKSSERGAYECVVVCH